MALGLKLGIDLGSTLGMSGLPLLLAKSPKYPKVPPELTTEIGWLSLAIVLFVLYWVWTRAESVRRSVLALEDPRTYAVLRVGFALMTIQCFWNLRPYWRMLWSDEGIFSLEEARQRFARTALQGWTPDEGFFDYLAVLRFFWAKHSVFHFWDSPTFVEWYLYAFFAVLLLYAFGVFSRTTGVIAFLMMSGIYNRNSLYLEGTDTVYRVFWFLLIFCKTGHAWSFDNWWRCRRLRRRGLLAEDGSRGPPVDASGTALQPVYRLVPAWPRYLMMAQLIALYTTTGTVKTGSVWARGDALYYALNMDHFYRFEIWTQIISSMTATTVFRVMTWVTHWWEMCFVVVGLGLIFKFRLDHQDEPWYREQLANPWTRWSGRIALILAYVAVYLLVTKAIPYCIPESEGGREAVRAARVAAKVHNFRLVFGGFMPVVIAAYFAVGRWPLRIIKPGARLSVIPIPAWSINQRWLRDWFTGRRVWLTLGLFFHGTLILFMNIGMFPFIMLMTYAAWFTGDEYARVGQRLLAWLRRRPRLAGRPRLSSPALDAWFAPAQAPEDVPARGRSIPNLVVLALGLLAVGVLFMRVYDKVPDSAALRRAADLTLMGVAALWIGFVVARRRDSESGLVKGLGIALALLSMALLIARVYAAAEVFDKQDLVELWALVTLGTGLIFVVVRWRRRRRAPGELGGGPAPAYTAFGRTLALLMVLWHGGSVLMTLFPSYSVFSSWRGSARSFFSGWPQGTATSQSWKMFAPNPPRSNTFMKTVIVDDEGWRWDLQNNSFELRPNPWIWNDRMRKMQRRMVGKGKWYLKYWAAYQCREWYLRTGGKSRAVRVEIIKLNTKIPSPDQVTRQGWYDPRKLKVNTSVVQTHKCPNVGDIPMFMKERYGFPVTEEDREQAEKAAEREARGFKNRRRTWENRRNFFGKNSRARPKRSTTSTRSSEAAAEARERRAAARTRAGAAVAVDDES